jgi:membrane fusion protein, copper/silver efflux system
MTNSTDHDHEPMPEGEESAPPLTHTMAIIRWCILGAMSVFALVMILGFFGLSPFAQSDSASATLYHCPMHPTYVSNQPGDCPICGMSLVPIGQSEVKPVTEKTARDSTKGKHARVGQYTCPMDPEVISDTPGKCPICGMNLELVTDSTKAEQGMAGMDMSDSSTVNGLVPVTIEPSRLRLIGLKTALVERRNMGVAKTLTGYITADETSLVHVHLRSGGWITKALVVETGAMVKEGQPLLIMYSQELFAAAQEYLLARKTASQPSTDSATTAMRNALVEASRYRLMFLGASPEEVAGIDSSGIAIAELIVHSPITGYVRGKFVEDGQYVGPDATLYTLANAADVWLLADVYEQDLSSIHVGQTATVRVESYPDEKFKAKAALIYPTVSDRTRTAKVRFEIANRDRKLRPGMYASVVMQEERADRLTVASDAVLDGGETQYLFVVHDSTHFVPRLVKVGQVGEDRVEILSGVREGETVVTSANFLIDSESRLKAALVGLPAAQSPPTGHQH